MAWQTSGMFDGTRVSISPGASPYVFQNPLAVPVIVLVSVTTAVISLIEFSRDGVTFDPVGLIAGQFRLNPGDRLRVTYTVATPVMTYYPM